MKYIPQVYRNWYRKSTVGWSIYEVLLDISGGLLSYFQLIVDTVQAKREGTYGQGDNQINIGKLSLSFISFAFNLVFIYQHYCLYYNKQHHRGGTRLELKKLSSMSPGLRSKSDDVSTHASSLRFGKKRSIY